MDRSCCSSWGGTALEPGTDDHDFREAALACLDGLYGFALSLSRDPAAADDLVQETFLRALGARRRADPAEGLKLWLFVILHNVWRNELRARRPVASSRFLEMVADTRDGPEVELERKRLRGRLRAAIAALPDSFRQVIVLRCIEGFSYKEIADIVGCPPGTVMSRLARGRVVLRDLLRPALVPACREERIS